MAGLRARMHHLEVFGAAPEPQSPHPITAPGSGFRIQGLW